MSGKKTTAAPLLALGALWLLLSLLGLHGFSLAQWHRILDGSPEREVLLGRSRSIRSDDYIAILPHLLAQRAHEPTFPVHHTGIGDGRYDMVFNYSAPVRHWSALFRPQTWGYFLTADFGVAAHWWFNFFGIGAAVYLLLRRVAAIDPRTALAGAAAFLFSPFSQFWSLNAAPALLFAALSLLALEALAAARDGRGLWLAAAASVWSVAGLLLTFGYVPYVVSLSWFVLLLIPALAWTRRAEPRLAAPIRVAAAAAVAAAVAAIVGALLHQHADTLARIGSSVYPGHRLDTGGNESWARVLRGNFYTFFPPQGWGVFGNICAGSGFPLFFPLVLGWTALDAAARRRRPPPLFLAVTAGLSLFLLWNLVGFPPWLAHATLLERVPPRRAQLVIGLADTLLLGLFLADRLRRPAEAIRRAHAAALLPPWLGVQLLAGRGLGALTPGYPAWQAVAAALIMTGFGALLLLRPRAFWPLLALTLFGLTASFNPLARGGTEFIVRHPLSRAIAAADEGARAAGAAPLWVAFGDGEREIGPGNLFRMLGVRSIGGVNSVEQPGLWRVLDPDGAQATVYRRYAHVVFVCPEDPERFEIRLVQNDLVAVLIHPSNPLLARLGITHLVYAGSHPERLRRPGLERLGEVAGKGIYRLGGPGTVALPTACTRS